MQSVINTPSNLPQLPVQTLLGMQFYQSLVGLQAIILNVEPLTEAPYYIMYAFTKPPVLFLVRSLNDLLLKEAIQMESA